MKQNNMTWKEGMVQEGREGKKWREITKCWTDSFLMIRERERMRKGVTAKR